MVTAPHWRSVIKFPIHYNDFKCERHFYVSRCTEKAPAVGAPMGK